MFSCVFHSATFPRGQQSWHLKKNWLLVSRLDQSKQPQTSENISIMRVCRTSFIALHLHFASQHHKKVTQSTNKLLA